jgi:tetratricopeptide (TPR) repeat protein
MARAKTKKTTAPTGNEVIENPEVLAEKLSGFEEYLMRNKSIVLSIAAVIAITIGGFLGYRYYIDRQDSTAQIEMFQAVYYFEADDYQQALNGDGNNYGFLEIINRYGSTDAGNLSHFYAGVSYLKLGDDFLIQARAYSLIGDAYIELLNFNEAGRYYERAANHKTNDFFSPQYHLKAGLAFERLNNNEAALRNYDRIVNQYFDSNEYQIARKHMARLEALASR